MNSNPMNTHTLESAAEMKSAGRSKGLRRTGLAVTLGLALVLGACAHKAPPPDQQLANARASIEQAEGAGAVQLSPLELQSARDKLARAEEAVRAKKFEDARELAEESQADAQLAERKSRASKAEATAADLERSNQQLRNEAQRAAKP